MNTAIIGGGPGGLYLSILLKRREPGANVVVFERNRLDDTFGFGVVFSDATGHNLAEADPPTFAAMERAFARWDDIDIHYRGRVLRSTGHGFSGLSRRTLLRILADRAREVGVEIRAGCEIADPAALTTRERPAGTAKRGAIAAPNAAAGFDLIVAADGANSAIRDRYAEHFKPTLDVRPNRFVWLGTTRQFPAFTFFFKWDAHGLWRVHAYPYDDDHATFIVETTEATWRAAGMDRADEDATVAFCEALFADELDGHRLLRNRSIWRRFTTVRSERWSHRIEPPAGDTDRGPGAVRGAIHGDPADARTVPLVLLGDAAHTAHFSIGSGTKLAMEDAIALADALAAAPGNVHQALEAYEAERRPVVESLQRAAQVSLEWFEGTERFRDTEPLQFAFNLLTRSLRVTHDNLRLRDPDFVAAVDEWFAASAAEQAGADAGADPDAAARREPAAARRPSGAPPAPRPRAAAAPPPLFTPYRVRGLRLANRVVVSPMCQYCAEDGTVGDWHLVHLGSRAVGGAGLVVSEMTDVSPDGRITYGCAGLYKPEHVAAWRRIVDFVHTHSDARIAVQLSHAGRKAATALPWAQGDNEPLGPDEGAWPLLAPSPIPYYPHSQVPREMDRRDMDRVAGDFVRAAHMAEEAGFDWLELHLAHGYLLGTFISPLTNVRTDEFGGPLENRMRFPLEVFDAVRAVWPEHKPMSARISAVDWAPGGLDSDEAVEVARLLKAHGCDIIDVSAGQTVAHQRPVYGRQFQTPFSDRIRHETGIATMAVGNISSYTDVNTILAAGRADLVVLARAHLWDPYWTRHAAHTLGYDLPWPPQYATLDRYNPRFS